MITKEVLREIISAEIERQFRDQWYKRYRDGSYGLDGVLDLEQMIDAIVAAARAAI